MSLLNKQFYTLTDRSRVKTVRCYSRYSTVIDSYSNIFIMRSVLIISRDMGLFEIVEVNTSLSNSQEKADLRFSSDKINFVY